MYLGNIGNIGCIGDSPANSITGCGLGYRAPVGITFRPRASKYVHPTIGNAEAWKSRILPPRNLIDSTLGLATGEMEISESPGLVSTSDFPTEEGAEFGAIFENLDQFVKEGGLYEEMPDWMKQMYSYLPTGTKELVQPVAAEEDEMADTQPYFPVMSEVAWIEKHGKLLLFGGAAALALFMLRKK